MGFVIPPHVSEREDVHQWPGGQWDDSHDEDCVACSGLMQYLAANPGQAPATLYEAERIRQDAGLGPAGGMTTDDLIRGTTKRYGWAATRIPSGSSVLISSLSAPGTSATASGNLSNFPTGHRLRRFIPGYTGGHRVYVSNIGDPTRLWWMDPEGPLTGYTGEWITRAELATFVAGGSSHSIASVVSEEEMIVVTEATQKQVSLGIGAVLYDPATGAKTGTATSAITRLSAYGVTLGGVASRVLPIGNPFALTAVKSNDPKVSIADVPSATEAQLAAARSLGFSEGKAKASAAVSAITL